MFGYLRFALAFSVLISHVDIRFHGMNPGVIAVVIFYILAGHVVAHLWDDIIPDGRGKIWRFYGDRMLRIFPLYWYVVIITVLFLVVTGYGKPGFSLFKIICNLLIVPLNFYMVLDATILTDPRWWLIPPAWSLGAELQAYLLLPLVLVHGRLKIFLAAASFSVYLLASFSIIHPDYFGYRLVVGVFFIFVVGSSIQRSQNSHKNSTFDAFYPWVIWWILVVLGAVFLWRNMFSTAYTRETFIGLIVGIPVVYAMDSTRVRLPWNPLLGALSYGVFLSHFPVIWWLDYAGFAHGAGVGYVPVITLISLMISWFGVVSLERYVDHVRKK